MISPPLFDLLGEAAKILRNLPLDSGRSSNLRELLETSDICDESRDCEEIYEWLIPFWELIFWMKSSS